MKVACIMMEKNENLLLTSWIHYHGALFGYENLYIFDNGSDNPSVLYDLKRLEAQHGINVDYSKNKNSDFEAKGDLVVATIRKLEESSNYDFFLPLDGDEFVCVEKSGEVCFGKNEIIEELQKYRASPDALKIQGCFYNFYGKPDFYYYLDNPKTFFANGAAGHLDIGYHDGKSRLSSNTTETAIKLVHLHNKPFEVIKEHARQKLSSRVKSMQPDDLNAYHGPGQHLVRYFFWTEEEYRDSFPQEIALPMPGFAERMKNLEILIPLPMQEAITPDLLKAKISGLDESIDRQKVTDLREKILGIMPDDHDNTCDYARALLTADGQEKRDYAINLMDSLIAKKSFLRAFLTKADFFAANGLHEEAFAVLNDASRFHPTNYWPNIRRSRIHAKLQAFDLAKKEIVDCIDRKEDEWTNIDLFDSYADVIEREALASVAGFEVRRHQGPAISDAVALILAKDEEDIIGHNLAHHYREGLRNFVILDNGSTDETQTRIKAFKESHPDALVYIILDPIVGHYQSAKTNAGFAFIRRFLQERGKTVRWLIPIDADEFICSTTDLSLAGLLEKSAGDGKSIILFNMHNSGSSQYSRDVTVDEDVFEHFDIRKSPPRENVFKVAVNCEAIPDPSFDEGNHRVRGAFIHLEAVSAAIADGFFLVHLPMRSLRHIRNKVIKGGEAFRAAPDLRYVGVHWRRWHQQYEAQGEELFPRLIESYLSGLR